MEDTGYYIWTGVDVRGRRFTPIRTKTPQHYNIYKGSLWKEVIIDNKIRKKLIKTV
jgi:hypothetical protein